MKTKLIALLLTLFTLTAILAGCGGSAPKAPEKKTAAPLKELKVTYVKAPLNIPSIVDKNNQTLVKGFEKGGTRVSFPEITSARNRPKPWLQAPWISPAVWVVPALSWPPPTVRT